jgi:hypothetical protein
MTRIEVPNTAPRRRSGRFGRWVLILLLLLVVGTGLWTWLTLAWAYSDGERAGVLQKVSRRGWVCKTYEGELAQYIIAGVSPQIWEFSTRDPVVAAQLNKAVGHKVQLHYTEHAGVPTSCFADTRYFVDRVTLVDDAPIAAPPAAPSAAPSTAPSAPPADKLPPPAPVAQPPAAAPANP